MNEGMRARLAEDGWTKPHPVIVRTRGNQAMISCSVSMMITEQVQLFTPLMIVVFLPFEKNEHDAYALRRMHPDAEIWTLDNTISFWLVELMGALSKDQASVEKLQADFQELLKHQQE